MAINQLIEKLEQIEHGFKHVVEAGNLLLNDDALNHFDLAVTFLDNSVYQARMLGTYLMGQLAVSDQRAFKVLKNEISRDENWRVQEMLAKAFDHYCKSTGYEKALPTIENWLMDDNPNVKRAVIEGLRIWTSRPYFRENPKMAIGLISKHKNDNSEYLRKSVGNALRDIAKKHNSLIKNEIATWDLGDKKTCHVKNLIEK